MRNNRTTYLLMALILIISGSVGFVQSAYSSESMISDTGPPNALIAASAPSVIMIANQVNIAEPAAHNAAVVNASHGELITGGQHRPAANQPTCANAFNTRNAQHGQVILGEIQPNPTHSVELAQVANNANPQWGDVNIWPIPGSEGGAGQPASAKDQNDIHADRFNLRE